MEQKTKFSKKDYMTSYNKSDVAKKAQKKWMSSPTGKAKHKVALTNYYNKYQGIYGGKDAQTGQWLYVGASKSITGRINNHRYACRNLHKAQQHRPSHYDLYCKLNNHEVEWSIIATCDVTSMKSLEQHYIDIYKPLYNVHKTKKKK
jgi:hypothetical protein